VTHLLGYLLVFLGGGLGSMLRHAVNQASAFLLGAGHTLREYHRLVRHGPDCGLVCLSWRGRRTSAPLVSHDGHTGRLHHLFDLLSRRGIILGTRAALGDGVLCWRFYGGGDARPLCRACPRQGFDYVDNRGEREPHWHRKRGI
jgi:hypothetical protein